MKSSDNGALTKTMAPSCPTLGAEGNHRMRRCGLWRRILQSMITMTIEMTMTMDGNDNDNRWWWRRRQWRQRQWWQWWRQEDEVSWEAWRVSSLATRYNFMLCSYISEYEKRKILHLYFQMFSGFFLLVNGRRNWGQLNKWAVLHFPSNIVQITCHCYNEKQHTILQNIFAQASKMCHWKEVWFKILTADVYIRLKRPDIYYIC